MCGINFLHDPDSPFQLLECRIKRSLANLTHRGPDEHGLVRSCSTLLGHSRLSIIDISASHQPMTDPSGRYTLTYNGEIYNYKELRLHLEGLWKFSTEGDTEVLLAGLVTQGEKFLRKAEGMWAFVLWDSVENTLTAARDRMGKKPLYYFSEGSFFAAASELPSLFSLLDSQPEEDYQSTADYFRYGYYLPGKTAYEHVNELLPGHILTWSERMDTKETPYWSLNVGGFTGTLKDAIEETDNCLTEAVKARLVADVEVGAFLSGGIDSSLIVALMVSRLKKIPKTFTIGFKEKSFDEREFAEQVACLYNTEHYVDCLERWDRKRLEEIILKNIGQPFYDASLLPTDMVSKLASEHVKVVLSGDGGDELFSGYQRYQARLILRWYARLPAFLRKNLESAIRLLPEPMKHHSHSLLKKAHLFLDIIDRKKSETPYIAPVLYSDGSFKELFREISENGHDAPQLPGNQESNDIIEMMSADALVYLPQDILTKVDRASMAHSLETRTPFLDSKVVQLAFSLPTEWHRNIFSGKRLLYKTFRDLLPENIWKRRKQGFGVPIHDWFRTGLGHEMMELLGDSPEFLNRIKVKGMLDEHKRGARDHGYRLWNIYVYLLWRNHQ